MPEILATPDSDEYDAVVADWVEFGCLLNPTLAYFFSDLPNLIQGGINRQASDSSEDDEQSEAFQARIVSELIQRRKSLGDSYPFLISEADGSIVAKAQFDAFSYVYVFCLVISHAGNSAFLTDAGQPALSNHERDLFQICATVAAAGYVGGEAFSFGWPRPDEAGFLATLARIYARIGDGQVVRAWPAGVPIKVKDDGIDIIGWRPAADRQAGFMYLLGQAASGKQDWHEKDVFGIARQFHESWFAPAPATQAHIALFVPFHPLEGFDGSRDYSDEEHVTARLRRLAARFGSLVYRYRLPTLAREGFALSQRGLTVERVAELDKIQAWVDQYLGRIRAARA